MADYPGLLPEDLEPMSPEGIAWARSQRAERFTVRHLSGLGWKVMDGGVMIGDEHGPWWPTRRSALVEAKRRNEAVNV